MWKDKTQRLALLQDVLANFYRQGSTATDEENEQNKKDRNQNDADDVTVVVLFGA